MTAYCGLRVSASILIGRSAAHLHLLETLAKVAATDVELLLTGPTGVGKELYAHYVHQASARSHNRFVPVNCGALPPDLFENELFGHVGGAFTGARPRSEGLVSEAEHGTLFLDEIDSLSLPCQVKLLRFIQEREYRRLGESRIRHADLRVIAASNADLQAAVREGSFREDLFFRLRGFPVEVPPLSERRDDIALLLGEYAARFSELFKLPRAVFSDAALRRLEAYAWPGNVRELENCVKYLTCLQLARPVDPYDLPLLGAPPAIAAGRRVTDDADRSFREVKKNLVDDFERHYLSNALRRANGNIARAALASGKPRRVFFELMRKHGITAQHFVDRRTTQASQAEPHSTISVVRS